MQATDTTINSPRPKADRTVYLYRWKKAQKVLRELRGEGGTAA